MKTYKELIAAALAEDIGDGDHSADSCIPETAQGHAKLLVKDDGIIAGLEFAKEVFMQVDPSCNLQLLIKDGSRIKKGDIAFEVEGPSRSILKAERLALNILQRMSGIATHTAYLVSLLAGTETKILDTRKTTPNFRLFEKAAVKLGGGTNHRMGLYDMIMIKDNHIDYAGSIRKAINQVYEYQDLKNFDLPIIVEARDLNEVDEILNSKPVTRILLDNFSFEDCRKAVNLIGNQAQTEASGGITEETIRAYALCGVNYISVGALTHQIKSLDLSLKANI